MASFLSSNWEWPREDLDLVILVFIDRKVVDARIVDLILVLVLELFGIESLAELLATGLALKIGQALSRALGVALQPFAESLKKIGKFLECC